jgi:class 3 adenylate cyclase/tetratricopeptide (TPR) repeat protein
MDKLPDAAPEPSRAAQRRYLTILFSDLSDSTRLLEAMENEEYSELMNRLSRTYEQAITKHGGTIVQIQGDGVLAIFGYPDPREDDGRRATEAALELHGVVRELHLKLPTKVPWPLDLHSGIHAGLVLVEEGDMVHGRFELRGSATHLARRLSEAAKSDEILVSEETLGAERHFFETSARRALYPKGADDPIMVYRVLARGPISTRFEARVRRGLVPFVGRQRELRTLEASLLEAAAGKVGYLAVVGPAGLGKTRLVEEFLGRATARGYRVHRGYCESYLSAEPLQAFLQMLRALCRLEQGMPAALAAQALDDALAAISPALLGHRAELLRALSLDAEGTAAKAKRPSSEAIVAAFRALFDALAAGMPQIIFIDDWQWADDATRQVLAAILGLEKWPLLVVIATREFTGGDASMNQARMLELAPFTEDEAAETIDRLVASKGPFDVAEIHRYSGGNPLFIEELCHSAAFSDADRRLGRPHSAAAGLNSLIESRVARLPEAEAEVVRAAAVIGNVIPSWLLASIAGCGEDHPLVQRLAEEDFLFPGETAGTLRFKHGITRDVIYQAVGLHQRRAMHLRIAEALRQRGSSGEGELYEALAYHYGAGAQPADAAHYAELAGDKAMAAAALDRAQTQYRAALGALDVLETSPSNRQRRTLIVQRYGMACIFDPARNQLDVLHRSVQIAEAHADAGGIAIGEYWLGYINYGLGESRLAIHHCERALAAALRIGEEPLRVQILATLGEARAAASDYDQALTLLDQAIAIKRQHRSATRPAVGSAYSLACKAAVLGDRGLFADAHACLDQALEALRGANKVVEGSVLCWRSGVCLWQGRWEEALRSAAEAQHIAERVKSLYVFGMSRALGAYASWMMIRAPAALQTIIDATSWLEARDKRLFISLNYGWLADGMAASGRFQKARHYAAQALVRTRKHDRLGQPMAYRALARAAAHGQHTKRTQRYLALAMAAAKAKGSRHEIAVTHLCRAEIELARGNATAAATCLEQTEGELTAMNMTWHLEQAARLRARL